MSDLRKDYGLPRRNPPVVRAWDTDGPTPDAPCLFANGFTLIDIEGDPPAVEHPYLVLGFPISLARMGNSYEIALHLTPRSSRYALHHPETTPCSETLIGALAYHLASAQVTADIHKARIDGPLPIYVVDPAWKPVAERFIAEYGRPLEERTNE